MELIIALIIWYVIRKVDQERIDKKALDRLYNGDNQ